jgi:hypothetical protein
VTFKQTIDQKEVLEMPLNGGGSIGTNPRQMTSLVLGAGGAVAAPGNDFTGSKYSYAAVSISIAGGMGNSILWRLDGGDNIDYMANSNLPFPFPEAVSQFSVEASSLGAQDGMHEGGMVNMVTKSGTNTYHGTGFEFIRNNFIDATNFYVTTCTPVAPKTTCSPKDRLHQNQYGGTIGGPLSIPHIYNGKDKLFFFVGYQYFASKSATSTTSANVPTAANLIGDFSTTAPINSTLASATGACQTTPTQLLDPLTGAKLINNQYNNPAMGLNNPGSPNVPANWNLQSQALLAFLPPVVASVDTFNCGVVKYAIPSQTFDKQLITREDYTINSKNHMYGRYLFDGYQFPAYFSPTNILLTTQSGNPLQRVQTGTVGEDYTINANTVNSAHISILRRVNDRGYNPSDINACAGLGVNITCALSAGLQLSTKTFSMGGGTNSLSHFNDNTLAFDDDVTMVRGKHQIVFGGEFVRNQLNISNGFQSNGNFTFSNSFSEYGPFGAKAGAVQNPNVNTTQIGDGRLDFLQGTLSAFVQSKQEQNALRAPIPSLYFQDTFHATPQLTIVAGLRWSPEYMPVDVFNRGSIFNMADFVAGIHSSVYPTAPAGSLYYGDPGVTRGFTQNSPWQFDPNFGLSYDLFGTGKTVLRAGAEYIYDQPNFFTGQRVNQNPPFATSLGQASAGYIPFSTPYAVPTALQNSSTILSNPFPSAASFSGKPTGANATFLPGGQFIVLPQKFHPAATMQWTASIQQAFGHGWQFQMDYIGSKSSHDGLATPLDPVIYVPGNWNGPGSCVAPGVGAIAGTGTGACSTTSNYAARSLFTLENPSQGPLYGYANSSAASVLVGDEGMANYNGLITSVNHRLSSSFSLLGNWTWSKCLDIEDNQGDFASIVIENPNSPSVDYGPCGFDYRNIENVVLVAKSTYGFSNRIVKEVLDNWEIAPFMRVQSGAPFSVTVGIDDSLTDINNDRASLIPGVPVYQKVAFRSQAAATEQYREYLNPAAFALSNPAGTFGTTGKNQFRGTPSLQCDAQVSRFFPIHDNLSMDLRLEAFNALNHPNFANPTASRSSGTFGEISATASGNNARVFQGGLKFIF